MVVEVALSSLPRKRNRETERSEDGAVEDGVRRTALRAKTDQGMLTCSTIELLLHCWRRSDSNRHHALIRRSNPDLTARKLNGAYRRSCTGLSGLQGRHVARYV